MIEIIRHKITLTQWDNKTWEAHFDSLAEAEKWLNRERMVPYYKKNYKHVELKNIDADEIILSEEISQ